MATGLRSLADLQVIYNNTRYLAVSLNKRVLEDFVSACGDYEAKRLTIIEVSLSPTFYAWLFGFAGGIRILAPAEAVKEYNEMLLRALTAQSL